MTEKAKPLSRDEIAALSLKGPNASSPGGHGLFGSDTRRLLDSHELLRAERDALAARVKTLEAALRGCTKATFGPDLIWAVEGARQILTGAESALTNAQIIGDGIALGIETCPRCVRAFIVARGPGHWTDPLVCCGAEETRTARLQKACGDRMTEDPVFAYECNEPIDHASYHRHWHEGRVIASWPRPDSPLYIHPREMLLRMVGRAEDGKLYPQWRCRLQAHTEAVEWALTHLDATPADHDRERAPAAHRASPATLKEVSATSADRGRVDTALERCRPDISYMSFFMRGQLAKAMAEARAEEFDHAIALLREKANEVSQLGGEEGPTRALWYDRAASFLEFAEGRRK